MTQKEQDNSLKVEKGASSLNRLDYIFWGMLAFCVLVVAGYLIYFSVYLGYGLSKSPGDWGTFGDFVGGLINPFIGLAGIYMLVKTLRQNQRVISQAESSLQKMETALNLSKEALDVQKDELKQTREELEGSRIAQESLSATNAETLKLNVAVNRIDRLLVAEKLYLEQVQWIFDSIVYGLVIYFNRGNSVGNNSMSLGDLLTKWIKSGKEPIGISAQAKLELERIFESSFQVLNQREYIQRQIIHTYSSIDISSYFIRSEKIELLGEMLRGALYIAESKNIDKANQANFYCDGLLDFESCLYLFLKNNQELYEYLDNIEYKFISKGNK